jgi:DNA-binding NarL/FixJ family response regulator
MTGRRCEGRGDEVRHGAYHNRELEVLPLLAEGLRNVDIADRLSTSSSTVEHHVSAVLAKLSARSRAEAVQRAYELGLLPLVSSDPAPK